MSCVMQGARNPISSTPGDNLHVFQLGQVCCTWEISLWTNIHLIQPESFQRFFFSLSPKRLSFTLFRCWKALNSNSPEHTKIPCSTSLCQFLYTCTDATGRVLWKSDSMQFKAEPTKREETMMWHTCPWDEFTYSFIRIDNPPVFFITAWTVSKGGACAQSTKIQ